MSQSTIHNPKSKITLIVAISRNRVIGRNNALPWRMPEDMKRFKQLTMDHAVIMGRRTFESLGSRPLAGRSNIVITRNPTIRAEGISVVHDLGESLARAMELDRTLHRKGEVFVLGGTEIFEQALPHADRIYLTLIDVDIEGDAHFPPLDDKDWRLITDEPHAADERHPHPWRFQLLESARGQ